MASWPTELTGRHVTNITIHQPPTLNAQDLAKLVNDAMKTHRTDYARAR